MIDISRIDDNIFRTAVSAAVQAPSIYNSQPWRFALRNGGIDVRIDPDRLLPAGDPNQWGARIACGAATTNIRLSLAVAGLETSVQFWPSPDDPLLVATVSECGGCTPSPRQRALHAAIPSRHSNRRPFFDAPVPTASRARLFEAVDGTSAWLDVVSDRAAVARIAAIVRTAEEILCRDAAYVAEMNTWIARDTDVVGIPADAAGSAPEGQDLLAMRDYGGRQRAAGRDFESDPLLAILGTHGEGRTDDVIAGAALQRLLLIAEDVRLAASMLSQPIEIETCREDLRRAVNQYGRPQMIVRIGFGQPIGVSARRPIDAVIDEPA